jgi:hypothetical protein
MMFENLLLTEQLKAKKTNENVESQAEGSPSSSSSSSSSSSRKRVRSEDLSAETNSKRIRTVGNGSGFDTEKKEDSSFDFKKELSQQPGEYDELLAENSKQKTRIVELEALLQSEKDANKLLLSEVEALRAQVQQTPRDADAPPSLSQAREFNVMIEQPPEQIHPNDPDESLREPFQNDEVEAPHSESEFSPVPMFSVKEEIPCTQEFGKKEEISVEGSTIRLREIVERNEIELQEKMEVILTLKTDVEAKNAEISKLLETTKATTAEVTVLESKNSQLSQQFAEAEISLGSLRERLNSREAEYSELANRVSSLLAEKAEALSESEKARAEKEAALRNLSETESTILKLREEINSLEVLKKENEQQITLLLLDNEENSTKNSESVEKLNFENSQLSHKCSELEKQLDEFQAKIKFLEVEGQETEAKNYSLILEKQESLKKNLELDEQLQLELTRLAENTAEIEKLRKLTQSLEETNLLNERRISALSSEKDLLDIQLTSLQSQLDESNQLCASQKSEIMKFQSLQVPSLFKVFFNPTYFFVVFDKSNRFSVIGSKDFFSVRRRRLS